MVFLFGGREHDQRWQLIKEKIKDRFKFGEWERNKFTQCGVTIEQREDFSFTLQQPEFLEQVSEIYISKNRYKEVDSPITKDELKQMRSVLGCLAWHAGQIAIELSAPVGLLLSKCTKATVGRSDRDQQTLEEEQMSTAPNDDHPRSESCRYGDGNLGRCWSR